MPEVVLEGIEDNHLALEMDTGPISASEIEAALSTMKMGKAPGEDWISADMLKADITLTAQALHGVIN